MNGEVELWWNETGEGRPVVLVPGRGDNADQYPERFVGPVERAGSRVIRYDPRDTGLSAPGGDAYGIPDLAIDVLAVLGAAGAPAAHFVGFSMGGLVLSDLIARAPEKLLSLTFLSAASLDPAAGIGPDFFDMVGDDPAATFVAAMHSPSGHEAAWMVEEIARSERRAPRRPEAGARHQDAALRAPWPPLESIAHARVPTLVVHGGADRKLPLAHGQAYANTIRDSSLVVIDDMGHVPRPAQWDEVAVHVVAHLERADGITV